MLKFTAYLAIFVLISFQAQAGPRWSRAGYNNNQGQGDYDQPSDQSSPRRHEPPAWENNADRYFKASLGMSALKDHDDSSGKLAFKSTSILPINVGYGVTVENAMFEVEFGFSNNDFNFISAVSSADDFSGNVFSTKIMANGMYKTSMTGTSFYVGGGLGAVSVSLDGPIDELSGSALAAQFILGGELKVSERSGIFVEFKNLRTIGLEVENDFAAIDYDFKETSLNIGFKIYY